MTASTAHALAAVRQDLRDACEALAATRGHRLVVRDANGRVFTTDNPYPTDTVLYDSEEFH